MKTGCLVLLMVATMCAGMTGCSVRVDPPPSREVVVVRDPYAPVRSVRSSVNLRTCPTTRCGVIMTLRPGDNVRVLGYDGSWANVVVIGPEVEGWMSGNYLY
ncbi:SH3 domain-containing protein [Desulfolutivibrio sulfoxidireducens]|uniref:SH3 domain-containing protein n=1 Tax=Desulfolutivibrio sulfoxidireducens TaxID=2773299 RepID=UPI00159D7BCE|nr:SH3 domain-containing protein [Desulfolutivibrio sulfoxidireducens]